MQFFASAINTLQTLVIALGAGLGVWGVVNLLEGYGSDNPGANGFGVFSCPDFQVQTKRYFSLLRGLELPTPSI